MIRGQALRCAAFALLLLATACAAHAATRHHRHHYRHHARKVVRKVEDAGPHLKSAAVLVVDATHSRVLYARRAAVAQPIASISKLLTAMVVLDADLPLDQRFEITRADCSRIPGAFSRLKVGTRLTRAQLLHLALMHSDNRAAHALGRTYPGGLEVFVRAMNAKARALGMTTAHFVEPTGLSSHNVASADDLVKLVAAAARYPLIRRYSTSRDYAVKEGRWMVQFGTTDPLVASHAWNIIVQKTGYISAAGHCLVMEARIGGRNIIMVLLDSYGRYTRVADALRVRRWVETKLTRRATRVARNTA